MIKAGWFFLFAGLIAVISSVVNKRAPIVNDVDSNATGEDKELRPKTYDRLIYGLIGAASSVYGIYLLRH